MRHMQLTIYPHRILLKQVFTTSHGSVDQRDSVIISLQAEGETGWGEATTISYYGITKRYLIDILTKMQKDLINCPLTHPSDVYHFLYPRYSQHPFALCAVDMAAHDLYGKSNQLRICDFYQVSNQSMPPSSLTIGIMEIAKAIHFVQHNPWPIYKLKLGSENDLELVMTLRKHTDSPFRVDANSGWSLEKTIIMAEKLKDLGVEFIEQPIAADNKVAIRELAKKCVLPLAADESCHTLEDVDFCLENYEIINIKLMKCGGITPALRIIKKVREAGKLLMIGCMTETSIGISAASQIISLVDYADVDGALLTANDPATGALIQNGNIILSERFGNGVQVFMEKLLT